MVGEGFQELDLRRSEGTNFDAARGQRSNEFTLLAKRNDQKSARTPLIPRIWKVILCGDVWDMKRAVLAYPAKMWSSILISTRSTGTGIGPKCALATITFPLA